MIKFAEPHKTELERILSWKALPILSLYMPVANGGADKRENPVRFKSLIQRAAAMLEDADWKPREIEEWKRPLLETFDPEFWERAGQPGFVCFYEGADHRPVHWFLTDEVESLVVLHSRTHVKPLLEAWSKDRPYYLLCLDHENLTLYGGTAFTLTEIGDDAIAASMKQALGEEREIKSIQFHTQTRDSASGDRAAIFHGHGGIDNVKDDRMKRFFQRVEPAVTARLEQDPRPLILCGPPEILSVYRGLTSYPELLDERIERHAESLTEDEARSMASNIVKQRFTGVSDEALATYKELVKELRVADSVDTVLPLAATGRVQHLFVSRDHEIWGRFNPENLRVEHAQAKGYNREDLLDTCARTVHQYGGEIHLIPDEDLSRHTGARHIAAILRPSG